MGHWLPIELSAHSDLQPCTWMTHVLRRCHNLLQDYRRHRGMGSRGAWGKHTDMEYLCISQIVRLGVVRLLGCKTGEPFRQSQKLLLCPIRCGRTVWQTMGLGSSCHFSTYAAAASWPSRPRKKLWKEAVQLLDDARHGESPESLMVMGYMLQNPFSIPETQKHTETQRHTDTNKHTTLYIHIYVYYKMV